MKKNETTIYFVLGLLIIFAFIYYFLVQNNYNSFIAETIYLIFNGAIAIFLYFKFNLKQKNKKLNKVTTRTIIIVFMSTLLAIYLSGLFLGFSRSVFLLKPYNIFLNTYPVILSALFLEVIRYEVAQNSRNKNTLLILLTIYFIVFSLVLSAKTYSFHNNEQIFRFFCIYFCPIFAKEMLYSYLSYHVGIKSTFVSRIIFDLYPYVFPIYPNLGEYLNCIMFLVIPYIIYAKTSNYVKYVEQNKEYNSINRWVMFVPLFLFFLIIFILSFGITKYKLIAIATGSMKPVYDRGDTIIYEKMGANNIYVGEVLAFKYNGVTITHRVVSKYKNGEKYIFKTKGDANKDIDFFEVTENEVLGKVEFVIPYIGFPSILIKDLLGK